MLAFLPGLAALFRIHAIDTEPVERLQAPATAPGAQPVPPFMADSLKTRLRQVALVHPGIQGVVVFEPSSARIVALNEDRPFMSASLAKLPVMLSLYKAAARGELSLEEEISILTSDVQGYGSGVLHSYPAGYTMTLRECASYMIKESDNTAWMMLERRLGKARIVAELEALGAASTDYLAYTTTPEDVLLMPGAVADPAYTSPELSREMLALMTDTAYEDRLPQPLPEDVRVAHKMGSYGDTFSDAGIVFPEDSREDAYYIVVISDGATEGVAHPAIRSMSLTTYHMLAGLSPQSGERSPQSKEIFRKIR